MIDTRSDEELARRLQEQEQRKSAKDFQVATMRSVGSTPSLRRADTGRGFGERNMEMSTSYGSFSHTPRQQVIVQQVPVQQPQTVYVQHVDAYGNPIPSQQPATVIYQTPPPQPQPIVVQPPAVPPPAGGDTPETDAQLAMTLQQLEIDQAQSARRQRREIQQTRALGHGRDNVTPAKTKGCGGDCTVM